MGVPVDVDEICERLQALERQPKIGALEDLQSLCAEGDKGAKSCTTQEVHQVFDDCYLHLLKCYSDRYESVRDKAVLTVTQFIERLPPNDFHMLNVVATLKERMGQQETVEESEEIRLLYVAQLHSLIRLYTRTRNTKALRECHADIVQVLCKALRDPYPAVQRDACGCILSLAAIVESHEFETLADNLAKSLYGLLSHKHSQTRRAGVEALGRIALHMNAGSDNFKRLLMEVSPLLMDSMPLVRRECGQMGVLLCLELRDRYSFFDRIIPLVLCCLKDDSPEVVDHIRPQWLQCGKQYYDENELELSKQELADALPQNYPAELQRPSIGCRALAQRSLRLLHLITRETADWKEDVRLHSLKLFYQFVLHAEAAMTAKFFEIYPDVARACNDPHKTIAREATKVADLMGRLLSYDDWFAHALEGLQKHVGVGLLKCFYYMFNASAARRLSDAAVIAKMLIEPEFSQTLKAEFQLYVVRLLTTVMAKTAEEDCQAESMQALAAHVYTAAVKVLALAMEVAAVERTPTTDDIRATGEALLDQLAERQALTVAQLHEKYFALTLPYVIDLDAMIDEITEPILLLNGLLSIGQFRSTYMQPLQAKILEVWSCVSYESQAKILSTISVTMLNWHETMGEHVEQEQSVQLLDEFVAAIVERHVIWHPGAHAEAMRSLGVATLCAMSQGAPEEARRILPKYAKYMAALLEDQAVSTRYYAIKCLCNFGPLSMEELRPIAYEALRRLGDASAGIRELAAGVIIKLEPILAPKKEKKPVQEDGSGDGADNVEEIEEADWDRDCWETFLKKACDTLFLYYDGIDERLQEAIKATVLEMRRMYPEMVKASFEKAVLQLYCSQPLSDLYEEMSIDF